MLLQLIIIQVITFLAIVFVLRKLLYTETAKEARRLRKLKEETSQRQRELQQKIEAAESVYRERIAKAEGDIHRLRAKTEEEIEEMKKGAIDKAKEEAERIVKAAFNAKEKIREEIVLEMQKKAPASASQIFKEVLSSGVKEKAHKELVMEVISQAEKIDKSRFNIKIKKGELLSAYPLKRGEKDRLLSLIFGKLGYKISLDVKEEKKLVAGVVIKLGTLVIDGSLDNRLRQMEEGLRRT